MNRYILEYQESDGYTYSFTRTRPIVYDGDKDSFSLEFVEILDAKRREYENYRIASWAYANRKTEICPKPFEYEFSLGNFSWDMRNFNTDFDPFIEFEFFTIDEWFEYYGGQ